MQGFGERRKEKETERGLMFITAGSWIPDAEIMKKISKQLCKNRQSRGKRHKQTDRRQKRCSSQTGHVFISAPLRGVLDVTGSQQTITLTFYLMKPCLNVHLYVSAAMQRFNYCVGLTNRIMYRIVCLWVLLKQHDPEFKTKSKPDILPVQQSKRIHGLQIWVWQ